MTMPEIYKILGSKEHPIDIFFLMAWTILSVTAATLLPDGNVLRIALGIPLIIFLPGYALVSLLWPGGPKTNPVLDTLKDQADDKAESTGIDNFERTALSFGLSLAIVPFIGIALNFIWDISFISIVTSLFIFILITSGLAWYRRNLLPIEERYSIPLKPITALTSKDWTQVDKIMAIVLAFSIMVSLVALTYVIIDSPEREPFSEFSILDQNHTIEDLPTDLTTNKTGTITIGIICNEYATTSYSVEIHLTNATGERQNRTLHDYNITLEHDGLDETQYTFQINEAGEYRMSIELYKEQEPEVYLENHLWITVNQ